MNPRKITVYNSATQTSQVIEDSIAETLADLKADLENAGISYDGMAFHEGISKVTLTNDDSVLPHDIPFRGQVTNDLVILLTPTDNIKIKNGMAMSRSMAYDYIREYELKDMLFEKYGKNYTILPTATLEAEITAHQVNQDFEEDEDDADPCAAPCADCRWEAVRAYLDDAITAIQNAKNSMPMSSDVDYSISDFEDMVSEITG